MVPMAPSMTTMRSCSRVLIRAAAALMKERVYQGPSGGRSGMTGNLIPRGRHCRVFKMSAGPTEIRLTLAPRGRFDVIDVTGKVQAELGDALERHRGALYFSLHTHAGYLEQRLAARLLHH